jgi:hypothetical protein
VLRQTGDVDGGKERRLGCTLIPPVRQAALGVGIDDGDRARAGALGGDGQMGAQRGLAGAAFLRSNSQDVHRVSMS